ncbi:gp34 [Salisaeta icosahedral phage 1]|uniref:gp34 n=1 Tax=Salisaeta icosahedral phage 1 TaxID=1183239 RepID=UPI00025EA92F|nr:gp34 [Salisaeta icosahedral phage 1]AFJ21489.1 gp34 [Salisaeta icosahedral phage 1]
MAQSRMLTTREPTSPAVGVQTSMAGGVRHSRQAYTNVEHTLDEMERLANQYKSTQPVRTLANRITRSVNVRNADALATSIWQWIRQNIRYVPDPAGVELLQSPDNVMRSRMADCDGMSTLAAALLMGMGVHSAFRAIASTEEGVYDHVYVVYQTPDGWHQLDPTVPFEPGPDAMATSAVSVLDQTLTVPTNESLNGPMNIKVTGSDVRARGMGEPTQSTVPQFSSFWQFFAWLVQQGPEYIRAFKEGKIQYPGDAGDVPSNIDWDGALRQSKNASFFSTQNLPYLLLGGGILLGGGYLIAQSSK